MIKPANKKSGSAALRRDKNGRIVKRKNVLKPKKWIEGSSSRKKPSTTSTIKRKVAVQHGTAVQIPVNSTVPAQHQSPIVQTVQSLQYVQPTPTSASVAVPAAVSTVPTAAAVAKPCDIGPYVVYEQPQYVVYQEQLQQQQQQLQQQQLPVRDYVVYQQKDLVFQVKSEKDFEKE